MQNNQPNPLQSLPHLDVLAAMIKAEIKRHDDVWNNVVNADATDLKNFMAQRTKLIELYRCVCEQRHDLHRQSENQTYLQQVIQSLNNFSILRHD